MASPEILTLLKSTLASRVPMLDPRHENAVRLFNGFSEGYPGLVLELYASTLVIHNHSEKTDLPFINGVMDRARAIFPWIKAVIIKTRDSRSQDEKRGRLILGDNADAKIKENNVWYSVDLTLNRDTSFYIDTRNLRKWLFENMRGKSVLNTFAYTGSLGVAALAGGAGQVIHMDLNRQFLNIAKTSYSMNGFKINRQDFIAQDFFPAVAKLKGEGRLFDCVILDPPFFSTTEKGRVDQENENARLINKVRPLIRDGGFLVAINNALFVSGQSYMEMLGSLCADGYLAIDELISIPPDCVGINVRIQPITDPSPFNHSTKIAILKVKRK